MRPDHSLPPDYFEGIFKGDPDPWGLESRAYEAEKHAATVAALGGRIYRSAFEIGCAGGALTRRLAPSCQSLLSIDVSQTALGRARANCAHLPQVHFAQMVFPRTTPDLSALDLILVSEVAYYWSQADLARAADWIKGALAEGGDILLVHWTGPTDYPQSGDDAVNALHKALNGSIEVLTAHRHSSYRLDLWRKVAG